MLQAPVNSFFDLYGKQHDVEGAGRVFADDAVIHFNFQPNLNVEGYQQIGRAFLAGFPDLSCQTEAQYVSGDTVITRVTWRGTNTQSLMGMPVTGKSYQSQAILIDRIKDGKIVERHSTDDLLGLMQQLGVVPKLG